MIFKYKYLVSLFILLSVFSTSAFAHKVNVFAYVEGDQIYIQGYFSDGNKAKNSEVTVYGAAGQELLKGQTNEEGVITFPVQGNQSLRIVLNAGQGHQATYVIPIEEITGSGGSPVAEISESGANQLSQPNGELIKDQVDSSSVSEAMVRKAVAQGVLPLAREISELKERRGFSEIVGGLGFIVGILGIFAYFRARQKMQIGRGLDSKRES